MCFRHGCTGDWEGKTQIWNGVIIRTSTATQVKQTGRYLDYRPLTFIDQVNTKLPDDMLVTSKTFIRKNFHWPRKLICGCVSKDALIVEIRIRDFS